VLLWWWPSSSLTTSAPATVLHATGPLTSSCNWLQFDETFLKISPKKIATFQWRKFFEITPKNFLGGFGQIFKLFFPFEIALLRW
jgi:hypothetical protein